LAQVGLLFRQSRPAWHLKASALRSSLSHEALALTTAVASPHSYHSRACLRAAVGDGKRDPAYEPVAPAARALSHFWNIAIDE